MTLIELDDEGKFSGNSNFISAMNRTKKTIKGEINPNLENTNTQTNYSNNIRPQTQNIPTNPGVINNNQNYNNLQTNNRQNIPAYPNVVNPTVQNYNGMQANRQNIPVNPNIQTNNLNQNVTGNNIPIVMNNTTMTPNNYNNPPFINNQNQ